MSEPLTAEELDAWRIGISTWPDDGTDRKRVALRLLDLALEAEWLRDELLRELAEALLKVTMAGAKQYEEAERLRAALAYYGEPRNHADGYMQSNDAYDELKLPGTRARSALAGTEVPDA